MILLNQAKWEYLSFESLVTYPCYRLFGKFDSLLFEMVVETLSLELFEIKCADDAPLLIVLEVT